jgi:hypothetical protein
MDNNYNNIKTKEVNDMKKIWLMMVSAGWIICQPIWAGQELTYIDLVERLSDMERLAVLPEIGERCGQWSSYDRKSRYDENTGKYVDWDANGDGFGGSGWIRLEGEQRVLAEMEGPGCIWRIWSADPKDGHIRIYLDGAEEPAIDLPFRGYFDGKNEPFNRSALVYEAAKGLNCYIPIPYQQSCKIVADKDYGQFHHFTYSTFAPGTKVPTFKRKLSKAESTALDEANKTLSRGGIDPAGNRRGEKNEVVKVTIPPGKSSRVLEITGERVITGIRVKCALPETVEQQRAMLRELVLQIRWDDEEKPSVWCPLGDFFGTAPGVNFYKSLPLGMTKEDFYSFWYMPFARKALVELINEGTTEHQVRFEIIHAPLSQSVEQFGRFHAKWHRDAFLPEEPERWIDWTMLTCSGKGRFCGVMLQVWNPKGKWWGEGDEKFFVDGEKFPSTFGTGSEDYFGYAWSDPALFEKGYHNQTICEGNNKGHISVNRWHIPDNVPFQKSFEGCIDKYFSNERPTLYTCVAYWYLSAEGKDPYPTVPLEQRLGYYAKPVFKPHEVAGMRIIQEHNGNAERQDMEPWGTGKWSDDEQLWWTEGKPEDQLVLGVTAPETGKYMATIQFTKAKDYGIVQIYLNGKELGEAIDLYNPEVIRSGPVELGSHELAAGEHKLTVEIIGANPEAIKSYMVGIDYISLEKVE